MRWRRRKSDPRARRLALGLGAARVGLGVGALFFTRPTLRAMLFGESDPAGRSFAKLLGGRDLALGAMTLAAARGEEGELRRVTLAAGLLDGADAVGMGLAARDRGARPAAVAGALSGAAGALLSAWAGSRLAR
jgi:hypothetical protein